MYWCAARPVCMAWRPWTRGPTQPLLSAREEWRNGLGKSLRETLAMWTQHSAPNQSTNVPKMNPSQMGCKTRGGGAHQMTWRRGRRGMEIRGVRDRANDLQRRQPGPAAAQRPPRAMAATTLERNEA